MGIVSWMVTPTKDLGLQNAILFGKKAFADIFKVRISKWDYFRLGWALNPIMSTSIKKQKKPRRPRETKGRRPCEEESRDWSLSVKPKNTRIASSNQKMEEARKDSPPLDPSETC